MWDPNTWDISDYRLIWDPHIQYAAIVDEVDYVYLSRWRWNVKLYRGRPYLRRAVGNSRWGVDPVRTIYLHLEVARIMGLYPSSPEHIFLDHFNRNPLDNRRHNLRWATRRENAENIAGRPFWEMKHDRR